MGIIAEVPGCYPVDCTENSRKVVGIVKTAFQCDLGDGHIGRTQQLFGLIDAKGVDVLNRGRMIHPFENSDDSVFGKT